MQCIRGQVGTVHLLRRKTVERLGNSLADLFATRVRSWNTMRALKAGEVPGPEAAVNKVLIIWGYRSGTTNGCPAAALSADPMSGVHSGSAATTPAEGRELWVSDGTGAGTTMVADITAGPAGSLLRDLVALGDDAPGHLAIHCDAGLADTL